MCLTLSKYIFSRSKVIWENNSIENFLIQKSCISRQFTPRSRKGHELADSLLPGDGKGLKEKGQNILRKVKDLQSTLLRNMQSRGI